MSNLSSFPNSIDVFTQHYDIQASDVTNVQRYQQLKLQATRTPAEEDELSSLTTTLREKLIAPDDVNKLQDCIVNLENFFDSQVNGYIQTKQSEFQSEVDKFHYSQEYNPSTTYLKKNVVSYNGEGFICQIDNTLNVSPTNGTSNANWALISMRGADGVKGDKGDTGANLVFKGSYNSNTQYQPDDAVEYQGSVYFCLSPSLGVTPADNTTNWDLFVQKGASYNLAPLENEVILASAATNVPIGITSYNSDTDYLQVFKNSTFIKKGVDYKINANKTSIDKFDGTTFDSGTIFDFVVFKNVQQNITYVDGTLISDNSISNAKLMPDVKVGSLATLATTAKSDVVSAVNEIVNTKASKSASVSEFAITNTVSNTIAQYTPTAQDNFMALIYYRVVTGATNVTVQVTYDDVTGSQTNTVLNAQPTDVGSYSCLPVFLNAKTTSPIKINITASVANQVYASASIMGV